jgi:hypothetical protein
VHRSALEAAAKQPGCTIERDGALSVVRDVRTENDDHAAWLVATKVDVPLESVPVVTAPQQPARWALPQDSAALRIMRPCRSACWVSRRLRNSGHETAL